MLKTAASKVAWVPPSSATGQSLRRTIIASSPASTASPRATSRPGPLIRPTLSPHLPRSPGLERAKEEAGFLEERLAEAQAERAGYVRLAAQGRISE